MANWAQLNPDLLSMISKKVELYEDFVAFRGVCRSWQSVAEKNNFCPLRQVPWLLLAGGSYDWLAFYSLTKGGMVHSVYLPEAKGKRILSSLGWLITANIWGKMELLHPLSRSRIPLPGAKSGLDSMLTRAALSASPSDDTYVLMIANGGPNELAYWRPGNDDWITIQTPQYNTGLVEVQDVVYSGGQFYAINFRGELFSVDINNRTATLVGRLPNDLMGLFDRCSLVDSGGDLIAVFRKISFDNVIHDYRTYYFQLFRFDSSYNCHVINDLGGGRSLFIGRCASVGGGGNIRPNCIYFTDVDIGPSDIRIYNLQHKEFIKDAALYHCNKERRPLCPPVWVVPSF